VKALFAKVGEIDQHRAQSGKLYHEFLRVPSMSGGLYVLPSGATDLQRPHHEDELYYVVRGRARFRAGDEDQEISAGSVLFVAAEVEHRFHDIAEDLALLVFFAPAES
jgi:mannose-6-phosphate isomerase-like protein (cupin superfamily)